MEKLTLNLSDAHKNIKLFLEYRLEHDEYRGIHIFQHNRLTSQKIIGILNAYQSLGTKFVEVPPGDEYNQQTKPKGFVLSEFPDYDELVVNIKKNNKYGSPMSVKKNNFPDLARLNVIDRFDEKYDYINPFMQSAKIKYFSFNDNFLKFIGEDKSNNLVKEYVNKQVKIICSDLIQCMFDVLISLKKITLFEFFLFVTWYGKTYNNKIFNADDIIELIKDYRNMSKSLQKNILLEIKEYANPENQKNKKNKRDYHNWMNEDQEIWSVLKDFSFFQFNNKTNDIELKTGISKTDEILFKRSDSPKKEYFEKHKIQKNNSFQLDHVVPFGLIDSYESYMKIDNWQNLVYIDSNTHSIKTTNGNKYMFLRKGINSDVEMYAFDKTKIELYNGKNLSINHELIDDILSYNEILISELNL